MSDERDVMIQHAMGAKLAIGIAISAVSGVILAAEDMPGGYILQGGALVILGVSVLYTVKAIIPQFLTQMIESHKVEVARYHEELRGLAAAHRESATVQRDQNETTRALIAELKRHKCEGCD